MRKVLGLAVLAVVAMAAGACGVSEAEQAERAEERRQGFHCLSAWDGNHNGLEGLVRAELEDPGSMATYSTRIAPVDTVTNRHTIIMDFGARNTFGGMARNTAVGWIDHDSCEAELLSIN